ncbi:MAG TPA: S9 family peptidase [Gemmatimonadales bacterium]|nr:S9 family peptidase [Gemmatimonadales bacterium]
MRSIRLLACTAWLLSPLAPLAPLAAQQRHTITHEDVFLMKRVSAPAISPDGRWVVFSVTEPSYTEGEQVSDLWIVPLDGSAEPRRLTNSKGGESGVDWSPDSRRIAFSARREGDDAAQIYVLDLSGGGEAQRVTNISTGAASPLWRPDGRAILFSSMIYPGALTDSANRAAAAERKGRKYNARVYDASPIRLWDHWLDERRPHLFVQPLDPNVPARDILAGSQLVQGAGFGGQLGTSGEDLAAAWTPDGKLVVFAATTNRGEWTHGDVVQALWVVNATAGEPLRLTQGKDDYDAPQFSAHGKTLYAVTTPTTEKTFNNRRLVSWPWPMSATSAPHVIAGGSAHSVGGYNPAPDKRSVFFLAEDAGHTRLFRTPAPEGLEQEVGKMTSGTFSGLQVATATTGAAFKMAAVWESATNPPEIVRIDPATGRWTTLTKFNTDRAAKIDWQPLRDFWFISTRGNRIHSFYALPPGFDSTRSYPLFVLIHGGAANMWTDNFGLRWNPHLLGATGGSYVVLMTDYRGSTGYGEKFSQDIQFDPLEGPANDINEAADSAIKRFRFIDASRQVAGGASYGGHLTNWLAVTTTRYRALVSHAGEWDLETQWATSDYNYDRERNVGGPPWEDHALWRTQSPMRRAAKLHTPVLVSVGERDFRVPMNNALEFWTALQRQQIPSRLIIWPEENHWILKGEDSRFFYKEVAAWFARWLGAPAATGQ